MLKPVNSSCSNYVVAEVENYRLFLAKQAEGEELKAMHLYKVNIMVVANGTDTILNQDVFVLAESATDAESQAETKVKIRSSAEPVPFSIRGWGRNDF
jgi:hypothetical protein